MLYIDADVACRVRMRSSTRTPRRAISARAKAPYISPMRRATVARWFLASRDGSYGRHSTISFVAPRVGANDMGARARVRVRACVCDMTCVKYGCDALVCDTMCVGVCAMCVRASGRTRWRAGTSTAIRATRTRAPRRRLRCLSVCVVFDCAATEKRREARAWVCVSFV